MTLAKLAKLCLLWVLMVSPGLGQKAIAARKQAVPGGPSQAQVVPITFADLLQSFLQEDRDVVQVRRFRDANGGFTSVRERLEMDADGSTTPSFSITFLGVDGEPRGSSLDRRWSAHYGRYGSIFVRHGEFRVRDLALAQQNYSLHWFGQVQRAGRTAHRVVVFPHRLDKAIWLLEVDVATCVPLYTAEFDRQLRMLSEVEVESFGGPLGSFTPWSPSVVVRPQGSFAAAKAYLGGDSGLVEPDLAAMAEFGLAAVEVHENPLNTDRTLVLSYTDGIDEFFVTQSSGHPNPFESLPALDKMDPSHTIGRYRDPALRALLFWDDQVTFHVAGRGSLLRLDEVAESLLKKALSQN